jgi:hypothetical protein
MRQRRTYDGRNRHNTLITSASWFDAVFAKVLSKGQLRCLHRDSQLKSTSALLLGGQSLKQLSKAGELFCPPSGAMEITGACDLEHGTDSHAAA